jgi:uncharacterized membrane protein YhaH (DUF805 family)
MSPIQAAVAGSAYPPRAQLNFDPPFFLNLIAPALLLSLLKKWTTLIAPAYGVYFTAEAVTILYAYFALARSVYVYNNSRDRGGRYDSHRARKAVQDFHRSLRGNFSVARFIAAVVMVAAISADCLALLHRLAAPSKGTPELIMAVEIGVWLFAAPSFIVACARWTTLDKPDFAAAHRLVTANARDARPTFLLVALVFAVGTTLAVHTLYAPLRALVVSFSPTWTAIFLFSTVFYAFIAAFALWLQCVWSFVVPPRFKAAASPSPDVSGETNPAVRSGWPSSWRQRRRKWEVGRINRGRYWLLIGAVVLAKYVLAKFGAGSALFVPGLTAMYFILRARFHDFGAPSWAVVLLMAVVYGSTMLAGVYVGLRAPSAGTIGQNVFFHLPPALVFVLLLLEPLLVLVAGIVRGHAGANPYGPPNQGFAGVLPRSKSEPSEVHSDSVAQRIGSVLGERDAAIAQDGASTSIAGSGHRRARAPTFGRR